MAQIVLDTDTFAGTNGDSLTTYNSNWTAAGSASYAINTIQGTPGIGVGGGYSASQRGGITWTDDQWAELQLLTTLPDASFGVCMPLVRQQAGTASAAYCGGVNYPVQGNYYCIMRTTGGSYTMLVYDTGFTAPALNDIINMQAVGDVLTLTVTRGGSNLFTPLTYTITPDGTKYQTGGNTGFHLTNAASTRLAGNWRAGSVGAGAAPPDQFVTVQIRPAP